MANKTPFTPVIGTVTVAGKDLTIQVNVPKLRFILKDGDEPETYTATDVLANADLVAALLVSKSSCIKQIFKPAAATAAPTA